MITRRDFIKQALAAGVMCSIPHHVFGQEKPAQNLIWANLLHLSFNMWEDTVPQLINPEHQCTCSNQAIRWWKRFYHPDLNTTFDEEVWNSLLKEMAAAGINMVVIDLGDGVVYDSHPEIAVKNAWTPEKLRHELAKIRRLGLEPIPKLNFATTHDTWLGEYGRMVSTSKYYEVCRNLLNEVIDIFDTPRFFHLGMDEETAGNQVGWNHLVVRQNDLWWNDLYFYIAQVEKRNVRSWIWSDYAWEHPDVFFRKMPKSVLQSNWYYAESFVLEDDKAKTMVDLYRKLEAHGYDQVPTGSNWYSDKNIEATIDYCREVIDPSRLLGFMQTPWRPTTSVCLDKHKEAIQQMKQAIKKNEKIKP